MSATITTKVTKLAGRAQQAAPLLGLFIILVGGPLAFSTSMRDIFVLPKMLVVAVGVAFSWAVVAAGHWRNRRILSSRRITPGILALGASLLISTAFSVDLPTSVLGPHQNQFYGLLPILLCVMTYYSTAAIEEATSSKVIDSIIFAALVVSAWALVQWAGHDGFLAFSIQDGRVGSTFGSPIFLGAFLAMALPLAWHRSPNSAIPIVLALLAAKSRGGLAAGACGVMIYETFYRNWELSIFAMMVSVAGSLGLSSIHHAPSDTARREVWRIALEAWRANPWIGTGPDTFGLAFRKHMTDAFVTASNGQDFFIQMSAHNDILQVGATLGLVGLLAYSVLLLCVVKVIVAAWKEPNARAIGAAMFALWIQAKVNPIPFVVLAAAAALLASIDNEPGREWPEDYISSAWCKLRASMIAMISGLALAIVTLMSLAEYYQRKGEDFRVMREPFAAVQAFNLAATVNPFDLYYTQRQLDYLWAIVPILAPADQARAAAASGILSERAVRLHPNDATARELRAISNRLEGRLPEAKREIALAIALAPKLSAYRKFAHELESGGGR